LSPLRETAAEDLAHSRARNISYTTVAGFPRTRQMGRDILQNHRTSGNNRTLANRYSRENQAADCNPASRANEDGRNLELEIFPPHIVASRTKKRPPRDANTRFDCDLCQTENPDIIPDPDIVAYDQALWKRDIHIAANPYSFPNFRSEGAE
jgi:hypothetical protein